MKYFIENCVDTDSEYICDKLVEYNLSKVQATQTILFEKLDRKVVDEDGKIIDGCVARMYCWNVTYVDILWVDKDKRGQGIGSALLENIERSAKERNCYLIHLDTFGFQAKDFYVQHGYTVFGILDDCPKDHCRYYLKKKL